MSDRPLTTDDIALAIEIPEIYDGTSVFLLKDGTLVNRFTLSRGWGQRVNRVDDWIRENGEVIRDENRDLWKAVE